MRLGRLRFTLFVLATACGARTALDEALLDEGTGVWGGAPNVAPDAAHTDGGNRTPTDAARAEAPADTGIDAPLDGSVDAPVDAPTPVACSGGTTRSLVERSDSVDQIALDDAYVYFRTPGGVSRIAKTGGNVEVIATFATAGLHDVQSFVLGTVDLTWLSTPKNALPSVHRAPKQGGPAALVASLGTDFYGIAAAPSGGDVYVWGGPNIKLILDRISPQGVVTKLPSLPLATSDIAESDGVLYAAAQGLYRLENGSFQAVPLQAGISGWAYLSFLAFDTSNIYFASHDPNGHSDIVSVPKAGGPPNILNTEPNYLGSSQFVVDGDTIFAVQRTTPSVLRMNKNGSGKTVISTGLPNGQGFGVAVDDHCVYWTVMGSTTSHIYVAPK